MTGTDRTAAGGSVTALPSQSGPDSRQRALVHQLRVEASVAEREGDAESAADLRRAAVALAGRIGLVLPGSALVGRGGRAVATCFGSFSLSVGGRPVALSALRPRARSVLRLLALQAGRPLHREVLLAALWPESDQQSASRSMLTTLSSVRSALAGTPAAGAVVREGAAYLLDPAVVVTDVALAEEALDRARRLRASDPEEADAAYVEALSLYTGDLLGEEGPAEWVVPAREHWRVRAAGAAHDLAVLRRERGEHAAAAEAARSGLEVDRHSDALWRLLVVSLRAGGDHAAADRAAAEHDALLGELVS